MAGGFSIGTFNGEPKDHPDNANLPNINQPATIIGITVTFLSLAVIAICLRLWVRFRDSLWGRDDLFVALAGLASIIGDTFVCLMPGDGLGLHLWTLGAGKLSEYFKHIYITNMSYCASATFIKLAILFQYLRLFAETANTTTSAQYRLAVRTTWVLIVLSSMWGLAFFLLAVFPCTPIDKDWNTSLEGTCIGWGSKVPDEFFAMFVGHSASNMVLDLMVLLTPLPFLSMLRIAGKSKAGLITLFTLGIIVCAVSIGRLIALSINRAGTVPVIDMPYYTPVVYIFSVLEVNIAIIAASIPIFWPVISTLATNKIWVVNEIEVRVEETSRAGSLSTNDDIDLGEHGKWTKLDAKDDFGGKNVVAQTYETSPARGHRHKTSIGRTIGLETGPRFSQESQRNLCRIPSNETRNNSTPQSERDDWFAEVDRKMNMAGSGTVTRVESNDERKGRV
ncbi:hypothetical protein IQ06DRAFT_48439 [Phaeosphaeriaceae sp. SRC1lsM3a]|nr:hypothetical protein IQ06DRAFT_48439 [Stagonospora sp. SRC1lsM3a]